MSTALYRRYRPERFADVIGQEHVTEPLMQALRTGRVNHAYLFSGPRGCGKTTSARILARCLNCEQGPTDQPCGVCDSCVALSRGGAGTVDVIEIDAASHGGVNDARDLREKASFGPAQSRFKVYIIDEAHMVTKEGFNALLKIVEEPPEHVKFIFATTEPEKVIGTIRSRTHHYPFRLVPPARLTEYLEQLCASEGVTVEPGVLSFVVRAGGGSVRDSLSVLDQLIAGSGPEGLTYEGAAALLGFTDAELLDAVVTAFAARDSAAVFTQIDRVVETGLDPRRFVEDLLDRFRDLIVIAALPDGASSILRGVPEDQLDRMRVQASQFGPGALSRAADVLAQGMAEMTGATAPRLQLELMAARVLLPEAAGEQGYAARLDRLERRVEVGGVPSAAATVAAPVTAPLTPLPAPAPAPVARSASPVPAVPIAAAEAPEPPAPSRAPEPPTPSRAPQPPAPARAPEPPAPSRAPEPPAPSRAPEPPAPKGPGGLDLEALRRAWPDVVSRIATMRRVTWTLVSEHAQVMSYDGERVVLGISSAGIAQNFRNGPHAEVVRQALIDALGVDARVEAVPQTGDHSASSGAASSTVGRSGPAATRTQDQQQSAQAPRDRAPRGQAPRDQAARTQAPRGQAPRESAPRQPGPGRVSRDASGDTPPYDGPDDPGPEPHDDFSRAPHDEWGPGSPAPTPPAGTSPAAGRPQAEAADRAGLVAQAAQSHGFDRGGSSWATAPATPGSAPSWATAGADPASAPSAMPAAAPVVAAAAAPAGAAAPRRSTTLHPWERAAAALAQETVATERPHHVVDDSAVSDDDEDIAQSGDVGQAVVERILGATVIDEGPN